MGGDVRDNKIILSGSEDEAGAAAMEEKEALEIQKRHAAFMSEEDFMIPTTTKVRVAMETLRLGHNFLSSDLFFCVPFFMEVAETSAPVLQRLIMFICEVLKMLISSLC